MKQKFIFLTVILIGLFYITVSSYEKNLGIKDLNTILKTQNSQSTGSVRPDLDFGRIPLYFIFNQGQVNEKAKYYAKASRYTLWMTKEGLVFDSIKKEREKENPGKLHSKFKIQNSKLIKRDVSRLMFIGANKNPEMVPVDETKHRVNYFKGNDPARWHCDVPTSQAVLYKCLYKNIELKVYGVEKQIEYDWIVKPGGNPGDIRFEYRNVKGTRIDKDGNLLIETDLGELMHKRPVSYQEIGIENGAGSRVKVNAEFKKINKNTYGFEVSEYDKNYELIIDPVVLVYSTYLGGSGEDRCFGIAVDSSGNVYVTGETSSTDFPILNQYQTNQGWSDCFVAKIDTTRNGASSLIYSTYLGGSGDDRGWDIAVDSSGCAYVTGETFSDDFPCLNQYQTYQGGDWEYDAFVTKIDTTQSGASSLIYSTYLGGSEGDWGIGIAVDSSGDAYVTGVTGSTNFPILNQYQTYQGGGGGYWYCGDVFVTKIDTTQSGASSLIYSTYLGGSKCDFSWGIAVDSGGNVYVTGETWSADFPILNQYQIYQGGGEYRGDAFVTKIDTTQSGASSLIYSTYLGGSGGAEGCDIAVDSSGNVYVTGVTGSTNFPILNQFQSYQEGGRFGFDAFVTKIDTTRNGASSLIYSTFLGGSDDDWGYGIAVDSSGNVYVTGVTKSTDFPILNQYQTYQGGGYYGYNAFVTKIDTTQSGATSLIYSTYLGGSEDDIGIRIAADSSGNVYVTGVTESTDFPTLNPYQDQNEDSGDVFVTKLKISLNGSPDIELNRTHINFGAVIGGSITSSQTFLVSNSEGGTLNWTITDDATWLNCSPSSGSNAGSVTVSVDVTGLSAGTYTGEITVTDPNASNSPQTVSVTLTVYESGQTSVPFGQFATPENGSTVRSSIPVTGWVLDDIGVESVKIYRGNTGSLVYIGDTLFVEGARPDIEQAFPDYPMNYKAGWGYMMLTNFLPNGGNGTFKIHAIAADIEGNEITLGTKTIYCDNANAVKPFGAIDTPTQGGAASGSSFINWGWVLTPQPNSIPADGSTINVFVDSLNLGHPTYNIYREDIATLFPGYANSDGAIGYFSLDTTAYENGVHTIYWTATDNAGNTDGIGSRYFSIQSSGSSRSGSKIAGTNQWKPIINIEELSNLPVNYFEPMKIKKGYGRNIKPQIIYPDDKGTAIIEIRELERIEFHISNVEAGYVLASNRIHPLPIGSTIDTRNDIFSWIPGPGFYGNYRLVFVVKDQNGDLSKREILIGIVPKFGLKK